MGGAVMFLIAVSAAFVSTSIANAGVTYGWTPDGGQGVKYIIQIPPGEVDQVVRSGEIASQIPREIRGHVSEVVIRVGNDPIPRITPKRLAQVDRSASSRSSQGASSADRLMAQDRSPMPIPAMNGTMQLSPIRNPDAATAMMKPAPQGGGMNLPGSLSRPSTTPSRSNMTMPSTSPGNPQNSFGNAGRSLQQAARDSIDNAGNQLRNAATSTFQNTQSAMSRAADRLGQSAGSQMQAAADSAARAGRDAVSGLIRSDDPRTRLTQNNPATREAQSSTNNPYSRAAASTSRADTRASVSSSDQSEQDWYDLRNGSTRRPSTDPIDSRLTDQNRNEASGPNLFENSNFGRMPGGLDTNRNAFANDRNRSNSTTSRSTAFGVGGETSGRNDRSDDSNLDYDPRLSATEAQRLPPGGYSFDAEGYPIDRQGYRLNRFGQRTDESQRGRSVQDGFGQDRLASRDSNRSLDDSRQLGRENEPRYTGGNTNSSGYNTNESRTPNSAQSNGYSYNNPSLVQPPRANQNFPVNQPGTQPGNYPTTGPYQPVGQYQQAGQYPPVAQYPQPGQYPQAGQYPVSPTNPAVNPYGNPAAMGMTPNLSGYPSLNDPRLASFNGPSIGSKSSVESSDVATGGNQASETLGSRDSLTSGSRDRYAGSLEDPDAVAAQPIFNGMLLLSVVTNVYLLFWLKNLRLQFRDTVASRRSASGNTPAVAST